MFDLEGHLEFGRKRLTVRELDILKEKTVKIILVDLTKEHWYLNAKGYCLCYKTTVPQRK